MKIYRLHELQYEDFIDENRIFAYEQLKEVRLMKPLKTIKETKTKLEIEFSNEYSNYSATRDVLYEFDSIEELKQFADLMKEDSDYHSSVFFYSRRNFENKKYFEVVKTNSIFADILFDLEKKNNSYSVEINYNIFSPLIFEHYFEKKFDELNKYIDDSIKLIETENIKGKEKIIKKCFSLIVNEMNLLKNTFIKKNKKKHKVDLLNYFKNNPQPTFDKICKQCVILFTIVKNNNIKL